MALLRLLLLLGAQACLALGKVQVVTVSLGDDLGEQRLAWKYLGKFGFGLGRSTYRARVRELHPQSSPERPSLQLELFLDEQWPEVETEEQLCSRSGFARQRRTLQPGRDGDWGAWINGTVSHFIRSHMWYYALSDCTTRSLANRTWTSSFEVEIQTQQKDGSHLSVESRFAPHWRGVCFLACSAFLLNFGRSSADIFRKMGSLHPVIWTLAIVVIMQYFAQMLYMVHLLIYQHHGQGSFSLEVVAEVLSTSSEVAQVSMLILIAMGYTLTRSKVAGLSIVLPVCIGVAMVHASLVVLDHMQDEASGTFTKHEGVKGWAFLALRLSLYVVFCASMRQTASSVGLKLSAFLGQFHLAASLYFLAYPTLFIVVPIFAPYLRKPLMDFCMIAAQVCSNVWLAALFFGRGSYFEVSSLGASLLPGASPRYMKED